MFKMLKNKITNLARELSVVSILIIMYIVNSIFKDK
jgi:hypothetical protein